MQQQVLFTAPDDGRRHPAHLAGQADARSRRWRPRAARDDPVLLLFPWLPYFDPLKSDPRYEPFLRRLRLVR